MAMATPMKMAISNVQAMKKFSSLFVSVAAAAMALVSCQVEDSVIDNPSEEAVTIRVHASANELKSDDPATKTYIDNTNTIIWGTGEYMKLALTAGENTTFANSTDASSDAFNGNPEAMFEFSVTPESANEYVYQGLYPASAASTSSNTNAANYKVNLPAIQNATASSYDPAAYIMVAKPETFTSVQTDWVASFRRGTALNKITLKNFASSVEINKVKITAEGKKLAGGRHFNLTTGEGLEVYGTDATIEVLYATPLSGTSMDVWFTSWDTEIAEGEKLTIVAYTTDSKSFTKEITVPTGKTIKFQEGYLNTLGAGMSGIASEAVYEESFASSQGLFTIENETLPSALTYVWSHSSNYMKASAYKSGNYEASSRLISPVLTLGANSVLSFSHAANYMTNMANVKNAFLVQIKKVGETSWTALSLSDESYPDGASWNFADATVALPAAYANQNVQIAFHYTSTSSMAGTWEVRDFKVTNAELVPPKAFSVTTASPIEVPADPTGNSYSIAIEADSDVAWTAALTEGDANALTLSTANGTGNGTINLTISENTGAARSWKIEVSTSAYVATSSYTIQVVQAKGTTGSTTDVLDRAFTGIMDGASTYSEWSGKTGASGAVYAGQSAGSNNAIQLRSNNSNSGIITTATGGNVKKVTITWNSNTVSSRTVSIYGKTSAYSAVSELYNSTNQGTLLGELNIDNATNNVSELTVAGNYQYIGIRSKSGALYIDEIEIEWSTEAAATYDITIDPDIEHGSVTASKATGVAEGESVTLTVTPSSGYQLATLIVDGNDVTSSVSNKKYTFSMPAKNIDVTATFSLIPTYSITVDPNIEHGTVTPSKSTGIVEGTSITLTVTPDSGYELASLSVGGTDVTTSVTANKYTFEMPGNNVEVTASFAVKTTPGVTATINFGTPATKINADSVTGDDSAGNTWTITTVGTTSFTQQPTYSQVGSGSKPATSITFTTTLPTGVSVSSISAAFGGFNGTAGDVALKVGSTTVGTGSLNAAADVTVNSTSTASGNVVTITVTNIAKGVKVYSISVSYN